MNKINVHTSNKPCKIIYEYISYVNTISLGGKYSVYYMLMNLLNLNGLTFLIKDLTLFQ